MEPLASKPAGTAPPFLPAHLGSCACRQPPAWCSPFRFSSALTSVRLPARRHCHAARSPRTPTNPTPWGGEPRAALCSWHSDTPPPHPGIPHHHPVTASAMESVALYNFQATEKDELPFQKGDTLKVRGAGRSPAMVWGGLDEAALGDRVGTQHGVTPVLSLHLALLPLWGFLWGMRSHP